MTEPKDRGGRTKITPARIAVWVVVGGIGVYLIASGIIGILTKGQ